MSDMPEDDDLTQTVDAASKPQARASLHECVIRVLAVVVAAAVAVVSSNNWCVILIPAAIVAFFGDLILSARRAPSVLRIAAALVIGVIVGMLFNVGPDWAFEKMLGVKCTQGIDNARIWRHYIGGPGEHVLIVEFTGNDEAWQALLAMQPKEPIADRIEKWRTAGGGWETAFDVFAGGRLTGSAERSWLRISPPKDTEVFDFGLQRSGDLVLFREPATGRGVALHVRY